MLVQLIFLLNISWADNMKVQDLVQGVTRKLGNRTDIAPNIPFWIRDAVLELTESYDFPELQTTGPLVQFVPKQSRYNQTFFTNNNERATRLALWFVFNQGTPTGIDDTVLNGRVIKFRTKPVVTQQAKTPTLPSSWTRINSNVVLVGPCPDQGYFTYWEYQKEHPFPEDTIENNNATSSLLTADIFITKSWKLIIEFWAARVGALENRMMDVAQAYYDVLFGDQAFRKSGDPSKGTPGLIFRRESQFERDSGQNERALQPLVIRSCAS